ncbi:rolling circle replication-associated protein [Glaciibacter psychrotolerans]|uniref:Replication-associated protein ORF2/G2P domain-containing protein n=1 Tax=Glaciibacter psychrotolerans TaxID=670054 RepID=A0A7Z0EC21_9MICO|nr:hypothetical protein [Leifsonia psychrotolerans]NYJ18881.1 hypothetical protein [Leifsonia psychrotolerans]
MLPNSSQSYLRTLVRPDAGWHFSLYPDSGEGGGSFQYSVRRVPEYVAPGSARDPERAAAEAGRRARARLRRYCAANRLNRLGTLTYAGAGNHDPAQLREHLAGFFRQLRDALGGAALPYAWVPEWHKSGHGLHAHFAVGRFIKRSLIVDSWPHGFVHIKLLGDLPVGSGSLSQARRAAGYLSKYVAKTFADPTVRDLGLHRYDVAQGFQPEVMRLSASSSDAVIAEASELMSSAPLTRWSSAENADWQGAPAIWAQWGR